MCVFTCIIPHVYWYLLERILISKIRLLAQGSSTSLSFIFHFFCIIFGFQYFFVLLYHDIKDKIRFIQVIKSYILWGRCKTMSFPHIIYFIVSTVLR